MAAAPVAGRPGTGWSDGSACGPAGSSSSWPRWGSPPASPTSSSASPRRSSSALIAGVCELIPLVGPLLGAIPALLVALTISPETALAVAVVYVLIQFVEGNVLVPVVMRNAVGLSPLLVLLSLLAGAATAGIVGALLAVPVAAAIEILVEPFQARDVPVASEPRVDADDDAEPEPEAVPAEAT